MCGSVGAGVRQRLPGLAMSAALCATLCALPARADTQAALCETVPKGQRLPTALHACQFSQRQGVIGIALAGGARLDFRPQGAAGRLADAAGKPVQRVAGLGPRGTQFRLADGRLLRVLWARSPLDSTLALQGIRFRLQGPNDRSLNPLTVTPAGLAIDNRPQQQEVDGTVTSAEVADLDGDGSPELYIGITSAGSGSAGSLLSFAANRRRSLGLVFLAPLDPASPEAQGHQGHDRFSIEGNRLVWRFPVYRPGDPNAAPSGGTRAVYHRLMPGEAGWLLRLERTLDSP